MAQRRPVDNALGFDQVSALLVIQIAGDENSI
jgi:hypothetical protein